MNSTTSAVSVAVRRVAVGTAGPMLRNDLNQPKFLTFQSSFGSTALATPSTVKSLPNRTTGWAVSV